MPAARVRPSTLRAAAFLVLAVAFALGAASLALSALVVQDDARAVTALSQGTGGNGDFTGGAYRWQPDATSAARDVLDGLGTFLAPVGFVVLAWATLASLESPEAKRLLWAVAAFVVGFVLFGPLERPVLAFLGLGDVGPFIAGVPGAVAFSAALALAVSTAGSRVPVAAAAFAGAMGVLNRVLYAMLPGVHDATGSWLVAHVLPLTVGWLAAALYAGALAAAGVVEARKDRARGERTHG